MMGANGSRPQRGFENLCRSSLFERLLPKPRLLPITPSLMGQIERYPHTLSELRQVRNRVGR